jgi:hypothetical protein
MQTNIKSHATRIAGLLILSASLAACGGGGGGSGGATSNATAGDTSTPPVAAVNQAPTISGSAIASATAGKAYSFVPTAADADGDGLKFSISSMPVWAQFDTATGRLSGTPTNTHVGSHEEIEISVTDGKVSTTLPQFAITVAAGDMSKQNITLSWQPPTQNNDGSTLVDLSGYRILYGVQPGVYTETVEVKGAGLSSYTIENLEAGSSYYLVMVAVNASGAESDNSKEVKVDLT